MIEMLEPMFMQTIGIIWQEIGVRVYQEGQHPDQAIANVLKADGSYRKKIQEYIRELKYFALARGIGWGENTYYYMVKFVEDYVFNSIKTMLDKLQRRLDEAIKRIAGEQQ